MKDTDNVFQDSKNRISMMRSPEHLTPSDQDSEDLEKRWNVPGGAFDKPQEVYNTEIQTPSKLDLLSSEDTIPLTKRRFTELVHVEQKVTELLREISRLEGEKAKSIEKVDWYHKHAEALHEEADGYLKELFKHTDENTELKKKIREHPTIEKELSKLKTTLDLKTAQHQQELENKQQAELEQKLLLKTLAELKKQNSHLTSELNTSNLEYNKLDKYFEDYRYNHEEFTIEDHDARAALKLEVSKLKKELADLKKRNVKLEKEVEDEYDTSAWTHLDRGIRRGFRKMFLKDKHED